MTEPIPYGRQQITEEDIAAVVKVLGSDFLTQGPVIPAFEEAFAKYVGSKYAVAVSNGTAALHLAVLALGLKKDEYVISTPITFAASVNCVRYAGGNVLFGDIDPETYLLSIESVKEVLRTHSDKKIVGLIPVDFAGRVVDLEAFRKLADEHNLWILEDACHAPGGSYDGSSGPLYAGSGIANASVFSFHPVKHLTTGEGGMITTNDQDVYQQLLELRTHGITRDSSKFKNAIDFASGNAEEHYHDYPKWYMEMQTLGYNYRLTDFQAALGLSQLERAENNLFNRRNIARRYFDALKEIPEIISQSGVVGGHAYHLYILEVEDRRGLYEFLQTKQIFCQIHYIPAHLMPYYQEQGWKQGDLPNAERYYTRCISIPMFQTLSPEQQDRVILSIKEYYNKD
jgi:UDP-4-amino-4,6-dideoxy-N-acetyl-beta-L-altrosamine transaminase